MTLPVNPVVPGLSGDRFRVIYQISGTEEEARSLAETARVEQSVEFPAELVPDGDIRDCIMGQLEAFEPAGERRHLATISFAVESAGAELTQLLNLLWGTGSFFPGFRVERIELPSSFLAHYRGPCFRRRGSARACQDLRPAAGLHRDQTDGLDAAAPGRHGLCVRAGRHGPHQG